MWQRVSTGPLQPRHRWTVTMTAATTTEIFLGVPLAGEDRPTTPLTPRESEVLLKLTSGRTARAIARELGVSERTVRKHLEHVYAKLGVHDRLGAVLLALRTGAL